jgi:hypothetical protein
MLSLPDDAIWSSSYSRNTAKILTSGKSIRSKQIIASIAYLGPCTTRDMAEYILEKSPSYLEKPIRKNDLRSLRTVCNNRLRNKFENSTGKSYPGLIKEGYVIEVKEKEERWSKHVLSIKGGLFACGLNFSDNEIIQFIKNSGMNHLFFHFLYKIYEKTSLNFVQEIFLNPILDLIKRKRIDLDDDMYLNFGIIADSIGMTLYKKRKGLIEKRKQSIKDKNFFKQIETLRKMIIYDIKPRKDWHESIVDLYYKKKARDFYDDYSEDQFEMSLFNKVMYQLFHGYHEAVPEDVPELIPKRSGFRLPHSKAWKEKQKWKDKTT